MEKRPAGYYKACDLSEEIRKLIKEQERAEALKLLRNYEKKRRETELKATERLAKERETLKEGSIKSLFEAENMRGAEAMKGLGSGQLELIKAIFEGRRAGERQRGERLIRELKNAAIRGDAELGRDYAEQREILGWNFRAKLAERLFNEAKRVDSSFREHKSPKASRRSSGGSGYSAAGKSSVKTGAALTAILMKKGAKKTGSPKGGGTRPQLSYHLK